MKFLTPIEKLYHLLSTAKRLLYQSGFLSKKTIGVPVISVGNLSFGGVGKTPCVIMLADELSKKHKVSIVCKSYKTKLDHPAQVDLRLNNSAELFGDEPCLIQQKSKNSIVWSGPNKSETAEACLSLKPDIIILDDGFSHFRLNRNFDLLLIDSTIGLDTYLREPVNSLRRSHAILLTKTNLVSAEKISEIKNEIVKTADHLKNSIYISTSDIDLDIDTSRPLFVFCGIANPESFVDSLKKKNYQIIRTTFFEDHFGYDEKSQSNLLDTFYQLKIEFPKLKMVTTEKDAVKLNLKQLKENTNLVFYNFQMDRVSKEDLIGKIRSSF